MIIIINKITKVGVNLGWVCFTPLIECSSLLGNNILPINMKIVIFEKKTLKNYIFRFLKSSWSSRIRLHIYTNENCDFWKKNFKKLYF